jgi:hypothetical protein
MIENRESDVYRRLPHTPRLFACMALNGLLRPPRDRACVLKSCTNVFGQLLLLLSKIRNRRDFEHRQCPNGQNWEMNGEDSGAIADLGSPRIILGECSSEIAGKRCRNQIDLGQNIIGCVPKCAP